MENKRSKRMAGAVKYLYLPDELWECIFKFLDDGDDYDLKCDLNAISVVSKQLFFITNRLRSSLTICDPTAPFLWRLFHRFTNLTSLDLTHFHGDLDELLCEISHFPLNITSLNLSHKPTIPSNGLRAFSQNITTLTSLICSYIHTFDSTHLFLIADCFPLLQELDLSNITKMSHHINKSSFLDGFEALSLALVKLRKVNLSHHYYINDKSIFQLFNNCKLLEEVTLLYCSITEEGIASAFREKQTTLRSLSLPMSMIAQTIDSLVVSLKGLTCIDLSFWPISDDLLSSVAIAGLPLRRIVLHFCDGYSYAGIFNLLSKYQSIQHLDLQHAAFLNDNHVVELSSLVVSLVSVNLSRCPMVTSSALFALVRKCPSLSEIQMENIGCKSVENCDDLMDFGVYPQLKSLYLSYNSWLRDKSIIMFASVFPNLHLLEVESCIGITEEGIVQVLRRCCKISHLNLTLCSRVKLLGMDFEVPKLKMLNLSFSKVDDGSLHAISKSCSGLLQLLLVNCSGCTEKGVKYVVENCTQLREINLRCCLNVHKNIVPSMLVSRPSLRKITVPPHFRFSKSERKLFLLLGCVVC